MLTAKRLIFFLFAVACMAANATHYRAGEISYRQIADKEYEVTVITYTDPKQPANSGTGKITVDWGDGRTSEVIRSSAESYPNNLNVSKNTYISSHLYAAAGSYEISVTDQNRVGDVENIPNSSNFAFYVSCKLVINPNMGFNNSPILTSPPIDDNGCFKQIFVHNPGAHDPDGDSLYYRLIPPASGKGQPLMLYTIPFATTSFSIDAATGQIVWNTPDEPTIFPDHGVYNIAIEILEYRKKQDGYVIVGSVVRDMQIWIRRCVNRPPVVAPMGYFCTDAGNTISFTVSATDPDGGAIKLEQYGGPAITKPNTSTLVVANPVPPTPGQVTGEFSWKTACTDIRFRPHSVLIKATDNGAATDMKIANIKVIGPAPLQLKATQKGNGFILSWNRDACRMAVQYKVFRRIDSSHWNPHQCETGIPASTGFVQINTTGTTLNPNDSTYYDDNNGDGLTPLINYCYRVVAVFPPRRGNEVLLDAPSDGYASSEVCNVIVRSKPIITHVSVRTTGLAQGSMLVRWLRPDTLDIVQYPPPFKLILTRREGTGGAYVPIDSFTYPSMPAITDTFAIDTMINTLNSQFFYKLDFISDAAAERQFIDASPPASSVRAIVYSTDRMNILSWNYKVPWVNDTFVVYRRNSLGVFDSIGFMASPTGKFRDTGLFNGVSYCYRIKTMGAYSSVFFNQRLINYSQEICGTPLDTIKPCPPMLFVTPPCSKEIENYADFSNVLTWTPMGACANDVLYYRVYFKQLKKDPYVLLATTDNSVLKYIDARPELKKSVAGCYVVTAVDSVGNESFFTNETCIDNCPKYDIPNVFTPGVDGKNDVLHPFPYRFVDHIDLQIYNRWGSLVYKTNELDINWDGRQMNNGDDCVDGVYFYVCDVFETYLEGVKKRTIRGTIHILR